MKKKVYLAGPIAGVSYDVSARGWRIEVQSLLDGTYRSDKANTETEIQTYSPMRGKGFLRDIKGDEVLGKLEYKASPISTTQGILGRDRNDCMKSDAIIMNLHGAKDVSIGTMVELGWADAARVPVILIMEDQKTKEQLDSGEKNNIHEHLFVQGLSTYRTSSVEGAVALAKFLLLNND